MPRRISRESERALTALNVTTENSGETQEIDRALLLWAGLLLETSPGFKGRLYAAVTNEWLKHVRGVLYDNDDCESDRTAVTLNSIILTALWRATGKRQGHTFARRIEIRIDALAPCVHLFRRLANSAEQGLADQPEAATEPASGNVIDLNCWRQSRPRPLKATN